METLKVTKYEELNKFAAELKANGFTIISSYDESNNSFNSYFHFYKDGYFGYVQKNGTYGDYSLSTVNKPCKEYGTGHRFMTGGSNILTIENTNNCLRFSNNLIVTHKEIINYSSVSEYMDFPMNRGVKVIV